MKKNIFIAFVVFISFSLSAKTHDTKPIMGWASWNYFSVNINDSIIKAQTDALVSSGLLAVGYNYVNIDDGFFNNRYSDGTLRIDSIKFPYGMRSLVDYIHAKGLKAGFYSEAGARTCGAQYNNQTGGLNGGMYGYDQKDADLFFKTWDFDFLKVDYCGGLTLKLDEKTRYTAIKTAIDNTGKDVNYNVCRWQFPGSWVTEIADSWRIANDITLDQYIKWSNVLMVLDKNRYLAGYVSPGHYNDMDMMPIGRGLTYEEDKSMFALWCILSSPLVLGNDLSNMTQQTIGIITNQEVIALNQDTTGLQAKIVTESRDGNLQVWAKPLNGKLSNERAVALFNRSSASATMSVKWSDLNLVGPVTVRDLWSLSDLGSLDSIYTVTVPAHGVSLIKVVGSDCKLPETFEAEYAWINNFNLTSNSVVISSQGVASRDTICSGRGKAGWLGNRADNYIEFRNVYAAKAGSYTLKITYISGENRNATMTVNGVDTLLTNLKSGGWTTLKTNEYSIKLKEGNNTIRFSNSTGWLPDLDKIHIDLNKFGYSSTGIKSNKYDSKAMLYPNPAKDILNVQTEMNFEKINVYSLAGQKLLSSQNKENIDISSLDSGCYLGEIITLDRTILQKFIK